MRTRKSLMIVALAAVVFTTALRSAEAQHAMPPAVAGGPSAHMLAEACATAFEKNIATGRGFGMAFVADQNGYPGPLHVLELKDRLKLTADTVLIVAASWTRSREPVPSPYSPRVDHDRPAWAGRVTVWHRRPSGARLRVVLARHSA